MTRDAIRRFQEQAGEPLTEFLSAAQRAKLSQRTPSTPRPITEPEPTTADTIDIRASRLTVAEAENRCQSNDTDMRLVGCTAIINGRGNRYTVALADAYDGRCRSYNDLGQYQRAREDCNAAISRNPRHGYAQNNLAVALLRLGNIQQAIAAYSKSIELKPTFIDSYIGRGNTYAQTGDKASAKLDFEKLSLLSG
jgi:tetratricopeptide (TPR) repeat protein